MSPLLRSGRLLSDDLWEFHELLFQNDRPAVVRPPEPILEGNRCLARTGDGFRDSAISLPGDADRRSAFRRIDWLPREELRPGQRGWRRSIRRADIVHCCTADLARQLRVVIGS